MMRMTPYRILAAGWLLFLLYAYPGFVPPESGDHLFDARVGAFTDWHPVMMTMVCRIVNRLVAGPPGMLLVQSALLLLGSYVLARRTMAECKAAIVAVCMLLVPPVLATTPVISPQAVFGGLLLVGIAALCVHRPRAQLVGAILLVVASGMHPAAWVAVCVVVLAMFRWNEKNAGWRRLVIALGATIAIAGVSRGLETLLVDGASDRSPAVQLAMADIVGTLYYAGELDDDAVTNLVGNTSLAGSTALQDRARSMYGRPPLYAEPDRGLLVPPQTGEQHERLFDGRWALALAQPAAYLEHRWHVFYRALGFSASRRWNDLYTAFVAAGQETGLEHRARSSWLQKQLQRPMRAMAGSLVFRPYVYLAIALVLVVVAAVRRHRLATLLLATGILDELTLFFVANRAEYRDSHWMITATALAAALLIWDLREARRDRLRPEESPARA